MQCSKSRPYSMISSASRRKDSGIVSPSAFAVLRLTARSSLVAAPPAGRPLAAVPNPARWLEAGKAGDLRTTSRCDPTSMLARLGWLAQFSETLAIAPSALGSAHRLTAKRRTPFSPRAHYKLSIWCWAPRYSRWPRPHELGELHDFYVCLSRRYPSSLAIWLATADAAAGARRAAATG
jgi:hypothetical protein